MPESPEPESLYEEGADLYDSLFGEVDEEETGFYAALFADAPNRNVLSLGCGTGRLEAALSTAGFHITGVDASEAMLARARQRDPRGRYVASRMEDMPERLPGEPFGAVVSSTLSFAYITEAKTAQCVIADCARRMQPGGFLALDIPVAPEPRRLQGTLETMDTISGHHYQFMWHDVIAEDETRAVLDTEIRIGCAQRAATRHARLAVWRPGGIRRLIEESGLFTNTLFHAPHDIATATTIPPADCLRAIVVARRSNRPA